MPRDRSERRKVFLHDQDLYQTELNQRRHRKSQKSEESNFPLPGYTHPSGHQTADNIHADYGNDLSAPSLSAPNLSNWAQFGATQNSFATQSAVDPHVSAQRAAFFEQQPPLQRAVRPWELSEGPSSSGSMFQAASNFGIYDSQFTTHQWSPQTFYVNWHIHGPSRSGPWWNNANLPSSASSLSDNFMGNSKGKVPSVTPIAADNVRSKTSLPYIRRSNTVYENHLSLKGRGYPVWIPEPNLCLPDTYREKGICIGDVGIITPEGGFDFLFNICLPAENPINAGDLPPSFAPISPSLNKRDIREFREFQCGQYLGSSVRVKGNGTMFDSGLDFEPTSPEGAILTLPDGAFTQELNNVSLFRRFIADHAKGWYEFVNGPRGREAKNGDLRVVVGCDKTTSWGMATFTDIASPSDLQVQFTASHQPTGSPLKMNSWICTGIADMKTGPDDREYLQSPAKQDRPRNQCLFVRTLSVTLSTALWQSVRRRGSSPPRYLDFKRRRGQVTVPAETVYRPNFFKLSLASPEKRPTIFNNEPSPNAPQPFEHPTSSWDPVDVPNFRELSKILSDYLSALFPLAKTVIANDRDWQSAIILLQTQASYDHKTVGFSNKQALKERLLGAVHHLNYPRYDRDLDVAYFEPRDITENAIVLNGLAWDIRNGRRTFEGYLFDSTSPLSQEDREQFIDSLITKLSAETPWPDRTGRPFFLEGHKSHALSLEFDIIPCIMHPGTILATRSIDDLRQETTSELNAMDSEKAASTRCLAHALYARYLAGQEPDALDEAIWWFREAVEVTPEEHYPYLDIVVSLCSSLHLRVQLLGLDDDRESLLETLKIEREINHEVVLQCVQDLVNQESSVAN